MKAVIIQLVLLNVIHLVSGQSSSYDVSAPSLQGLEGRLFANEIRVIGLGQKLKSLKIRLKETADVRTVDKIINDVKRKVAALEGTGCATNQMQCGGDQRQCVSELLVCDGIKDCKNGRDEDPKFCDISALYGGVSYTFRDVAHKLCRILVGREEYGCRLTAESIKRSKVYPPHVHLSGAISCDLESEHRPMVRFPVEGYYNSANRRWIEYNAASPVTANCQFNEENFERGFCSLSLGSGSKSCGENLPIVREH